MDDLKRLLRKKTLAPLLAEARTLVEGRVRLAVRDLRGGLLAADPADGREPTAHTPGVAVALLAYQGEEVGRLLLAEEGDAPLVAPERLAAFLGRTLNELLATELARRAVTAETLDRYREIEMLHAATLSLNTTLRLDAVGQSLLAECRKAGLPAEMGLLVMREPGREGEPLTLSFGPSQLFGLSRLTETALFREVASKNRGEIVNDLMADPRWRGEVAGLRSLMIIPLVSPNLAVGALALASTQIAPFQAAHLKRISTLGAVAAISMGNAHHFEGMQVLMDALLQALAAAIDSRDPFTSGHSQRVASLSVALAREINAANGHFRDVTFSEAQLHEIYYAGLLHDIGKIGVREHILTKHERLPSHHIQVIGMRMALHAQATGQEWLQDFQKLQRINRSGRLSEDDILFVRRMNDTTFVVDGMHAKLVEDWELASLIIREGNLTPDERREIERHPEESFRILQHIPFTENFANLLTIIQQHHERLDGTGYPAGLQADDILLQSRVLMITDIYDAITQERHYKRALSREEALRVLDEQVRANKIDGPLVDLFVQKVDAIERELQGEGDPATRLLQHSRGLTPKRGALAAKALVQ